MAFDKSRQTGGALFNNTRKERETHPDRTGYIEITPEFYRVIGEHMAKANGGTIRLDVSAWVKKSDRAGEFLSLALKEPFIKKPRNNSSDVPF